MRYQRIFLLIFVAGLPAVICRCSASSIPHRVVCYLGSWANYRSGEGKFLIEDIDPQLCTHLVYGFAKLGHDNKITAYDPYLDLKDNWGLGAFERFTGLKQKNPHLKTLLAVGGWNEGSSKYSRMAKDPASRRTFVDSCLQMLHKFDFDGLDLDWEYPATRGGLPADQRNFILLIKDLKAAFSPHELLLTAAVSAGQDTIDKAYDIPALGRYLDLIHLMAYDFHGGWDQTTGHNAPLYPRPDESEAQKKLNVDSAVRYWLKRGAPAHKLILGIPLYGRSFTLKDAAQSGLDAPVRGKGMAGEHTRERGYLGYNEICRMLAREKGWNVTLNKHVQAPYAVKDTQWIGFDDVQSIRNKVDYLLEMNLGGAMVWSLETDDFRGKCHGIRYPLLQAIRDALNRTQTDHPDLDFDQDNSIFPSTVTSTHWTTWTPSRATSAGTTEMPLPCPQGGYFRHPKNCKLFYLCQPRRPGWDAAFQIYLFTCGAGTVFSEKMTTCEFPVNVPGCTDATR